LVPIATLTGEESPNAIEVGPLRGYGTLSAVGWRTTAAFLTAMTMLAMPSGALACSGPLPPATDSIATAAAVALVRVEAAPGPRLDGGYLLAVEERFRGSVDPVLQTGPLEYAGCGSLIDAAVGDRLVIAFGARPFSASPKDFNPYWRVARDGGLEPEGIDDSMLGWRTLADLRAGIAGAGAPPEVEISDQAPNVVTRPALVIVGGVLGAAGLLFVGAWLVARREAS
jgi:hypothetical protein